MKIRRERSRENKTSVELPYFGVNCQAGILGVDRGKTDPRTPVFKKPLKPFK
jgi:hypothetical protein